MKRIQLFIAVTMILIAASTNAFAMMAATPTIAPQIVDDPTNPGNNKVLQFQVADSFMDVSWAEVNFSAPVKISDHASITVQLDIYREGGGNWLENFRWGWMGDGLTPGWGAQWDHWGPPNDPWTYPFGWVDSYQHTPTLTDGWTTLEMVWDFTNNTVNSRYGWQGGPLVQVDIGQPITATGTQLFGWWLTLTHEAATGTGDEIILIDNLKIFGSNIYDANGFEGFLTGDVNGQDNGLPGAWGGGSFINPVPAPSSLILLFSSLIGIAALKRRP